MANNYTFFDSSASVQTAASTDVGGAHQQIIQVGSVLSRLPAVEQGTNPWIITGSVQSTASPNQSVSGTVLTNQGTNPWVITGSVQTTAAANQSVSGTVNVGTLPNNSVAVMSVVPHSVAALQGTNPWVIVGSVQSTAAPNQSVSGTIVANQGTNPWVITGSVQTTAAPNQSVSGTVNVGTAPNTSVAVMSVAPHSVATLQGTNPWVVVGSVVNVGTFPPSSVSGVGIFNVAHTGAGSVFTLPYNEQRTSIFTQGSTVNAGDVASVLLFGAPGASLRNYVTDWAISNTGSVATLIRFTEGGASILGKTIAPATGGSNMAGMGTPMRNNRLNQPINMVVDTAASVVHYTLWGYQA